MRLQSFKSVRRVAALTAVAAAALVLADPAGAAQQLWVTKAGSAPSGTNVSVSAAAAGALTLKDTKNGFTVVCTTATVPGEVQTGEQSARFTWNLDLRHADLSGCSAEDGQLPVTLVGYSAVWLDPASYRSGVVSGQIEHLKFRVHVPSQHCAFKVVGTAPMHYRNSTSQLSALAGAAHLKAFTPTPCTTPVVHARDKLSMHVHFDISADDSGDNPVTLKPKH